MKSLPFFLIGSVGDCGQNYPWEDQEEWDTTDKVSKEVVTKINHMALLALDELCWSYSFICPFCSDTRSFKLQDVFSLENEGSDDVTTLIDKKVKNLCLNWYWKHWSISVMCA